MFIIAEVVEHIKVIKLIYEHILPFKISNSPFNIALYKIKTFCFLYLPEERFIRFQRKKVSDIRMESLPNVHFAFFYTDPSWNVFIINIARG
jgi:hypothetical protein